MYMIISSYISFSLMFDVSKHCLWMVNETRSTTIVTASIVWRQLAVGRSGGCTLAVSARLFAEMGRLTSTCRLIGAQKNTFMPVAQRVSLGITWIWEIRPL